MDPVSLQISASADWPIALAGRLEPIEILADWPIAASRLEPIECRVARQRVQQIGSPLLVYTQLLLYVL